MMGQEAAPASCRSSRSSVTACSSLWRRGRRTLPASTSSRSMSICDSSRMTCRPPVRSECISSTSADLKRARSGVR